MSQYIGEFQPLDHLKGSSGFSFTAFISNKYCAIFALIFRSRSMAQMYRIFFRNHSFSLLEAGEMNHDVILQRFDKKYIKHLLKFLSDKQEPMHIAFANETHFERFKDSFKLVIAGGGAVFSGENDILLIHRLGVWDLPKGKLDKGESIEECSIREVEEETCAKGLKIIEELQPTYHILYRKSWQLKKTHWFKMSCSEPSEIKPQKEESIDRVEWRDLGSINVNDLHTYESIRDVLHQL